MKPKRAVMLLFSMALSIGGVSQAFEGMRFLVQKDLDRVQVVRQGTQGETVVASVQSSFAGNSLYKLARVLPDRMVAQKVTLFDHELLARGYTPQTLARELTLINDSIRREFFSSTIPFGDLIHEKASKYDVDPVLVASVMEAESRFKQRARSHKGAQGLMQLMPRTGRWMGARNLYDPDQNVDAGVKYLKYLEERFDGDLNKMIAAYNAGEGNVRKYGGVPPYRETRTYLKKVLSNYEKNSTNLAQYGRSPLDRGPLAAR
ncbi:MAG TPA: lytic transglycosylase domain-containing protein [Thermoanaerobaculia bacterium]|nr:lytic transglycosylase domain-containing protein [Thermoanaerobaculia bacterium]